MRKIDYRKILNQLLNEYPHELDKIERVVTDAKENSQSVSIEFDEIIKNKTWNAKEKAKLLTIFGYNTQDRDIYYIDKDGYSRTEDAHRYTIEHDILSGFEALMKIFKDVENHYFGLSKDKSCKNIFNLVMGYCKDENKTAYLKAILDNLTEDDIKRLIIPEYVGNGETSIFNSIILSKDRKLIKKYISYVDNLNIHLSEAVATGDIEIVKLFLEKGANLNYSTDEVIPGKLTPLKVAIGKNDYAMVKFLIDNGASVNPKDTAGMLSPLEYATKLRTENYRDNWAYNRFNVYFKEGGGNNKFSINLNDISEQVKNRIKTIDLIFDSLDDKSGVNYDDLIAFTFVTRDLEHFKKYSKYAFENNYQIDFDSIFELYFAFNAHDYKEMIVPFLDFVSKYDEDSNIYLKLLNCYIERKVKNDCIYRFDIDDFNKALLNRIPEEKRKEVCLVPYCKTLESLENLLALGFDINQVDENGESILYYLLYNRSTTTDLGEYEIELFNYLLENLDLSIKDDDNKTALYYAIQAFSTDDEWKYGEKGKVGTLTHLEEAVASLISKMSSQDVCNDDITRVLEERSDYCGKFGDKIHWEYVYQHHKDLFDALVDKGFVLSDKLFNDIANSLAPDNEAKKKQLEEYVDIDKTLDFLYTRLDHDVQTQDIDIEQEFKNLMYDSRKNETTFDEFLDSVTRFNNQVNSLNQFYEEHIEKKANPERYLQYAKEKYNTVYDGLDKYFPLIIIKGIREFGNDKLEDILNALPNYDINSYVEDSDVGFNYWTYVAQINEIIGYDDEEEPIYSDEHFEAARVFPWFGDNISFTGGLMQYAILTDNLPMVQLLQKRGADLTLSIDGKDHTWDYVNSYTMLHYMESFIGEKRYSGLDNDEKDYYLDLVNPNTENSSEQPKQFVKGKLQQGTTKKEEES